MDRLDIIELLADELHAAAPSEWAALREFLEEFFDTHDLHQLPHPDDRSELDLRLLGGLELALTTAIRRGIRSSSSVQTAAYPRTPETP